MVCVRVLALLAATLTCVNALVKKSKAKQRSLDGYSFEDFTRSFGRSYASESKELSRRKAIFLESLDEVVAANSRNVREDRSWVAGIHPFMDWTKEERRALHGYKPSRHLRAMATLQMAGVSRFGQSENETQEVDRTDFRSPLEPPLRQQGGCGSCWAISAVEAVEAQLQKLGADRSVRLSAQALVDCVPNPQHCGGKGGCDGATGELAYAYMRDHGIPVESDLPYDAKTDACPSQLPAKRVKVEGWNNLQSNRAKPLMQALVQQGPAVVALDANDWFYYDSGIFDSCSKDATLGHAVLAKGYGQDNGKKYWLIQNSWGANWGESGHIRLLRHDDEDEWCGTDSKPEEGLGCDGGPPTVKVCGMCGLLYDPVVPQGVRYVKGDSAMPVDTMPRYTVNADSAGETSAPRKPITAADGQAEMAKLKKAASQLSVDPADMASMEAFFKT